MSCGVFLDGRPTEVVAEGLPVLNGFDRRPDGLLYTPTGGAAGSFGTGGLGRLDPTTGEFEQLTLSFPGSSRTGFDFACGADVADDGAVFVAQCFNPSVHAVDPDTGVGHARRPRAAGGSGQPGRARRRPCPAVRLLRRQGRGVHTDLRRHLPTATLGIGG